jgi:hypothetical protein
LPRGLEHSTPAVPRQATTEGCAAEKPGITSRCCRRGGPLPRRRNARLRQRARTRGGGPAAGAGVLRGASPHARRAGRGTACWSRRRRRAPSTQSTRVGDGGVPRGDINHARTFAAELKR